MKIAIIFAILTCLACYSRAQELPPLELDSSESDLSSGTDLGSLGIHFAKQLLSSNFIQKKLEVLFDVINLKLGLVTIIKSLFTQDNLLLARRIIGWVSELCTFIGKFLPELPDNDTGSIFGLLFSGAPTNNLIDDGNEVAPAHTQKPLTEYGPPSTTTTKPFTSEGTETKVEVNVKRSAELTEEDKELIKNYSDDVLNLSKLIYARKI